MMSIFLFDYHHCFHHSYIDQASTLDKDSRKLTRVVFILLFY